MDNPNNHFIVQMLSKCAENTAQNALQILFGKTELWMHAHFKIDKSDIAKIDPF